MSYHPPDPAVWQGRKSKNSAYLHEKVICTSIASLEKVAGRSYVLLGYACDEGVRRNLGRVGASQGPAAIRTQLAKLASHIGPFTQFYDVGDIACEGSDLESVQEELSRAVHNVLVQGAFPVLLGGGHDIAFGHYQGIRKFLQDRGTGAHLGIINLDAHFDLRVFEGKSTSGTPFHQIAQLCKAGGTPFHYCCLGIQRLSNIAELYHTANELGVQFLESTDFHQGKIDRVIQTLQSFSAQVDYLYLTIDMDGFSASHAPGVSAPSPLGFEPRMALEVIRFLVKTGKLISMDIAELNPGYDVDDRTARLSAQLVGQALLLLEEN